MKIKQRRVDVDNFLVGFGRIPPQALDIEEAIIGECIADNKAQFFSTLLLPEHFYKEAHQELFKCFMDMLLEGQRVDLLLVYSKLKDIGKLEICGGISYLTELEGRSVYRTEETLSKYADIIKEKATKRALITASAQATMDCYEDNLPVETVIGDLSSKVLGIALSNDSDEATSNQVVSRMARKVGQKDNSVTMSTGYSFLDRKLKLRRRQGKLIFIGARPSVGKSALMSSMMKNMAQSGIKCGCVSLEMSSDEIVGRMVVSELDGRFENPFEPEDVRPEDITNVTNVMSRIADLPIWYADETFKMAALEMLISSWVFQHKIEVIFIDFLQKIVGVEPDAFKAISANSSSLQRLKKRLCIPIFCISSLNRKSESNNGRPTLSDFRGSGDIESDADVVMLLWRPEQYGLAAIETTYGSQPSKNMMEINFAKNRNGDTGCEYCSVNLAKNKFFPFPYEGNSSTGSSFSKVESTFENDSPF